MFDWLPESVRPHFVNGISALAIIILALIVHVGITRASRYLEERKRLPAIVLQMVGKLLRILLLIATVMIVLEQIGILGNVWVLLSTLLGMFAVGLVAVWSVLSNGLCTLMLLIFQPFRVGDTIRIAGEDIGGKVIDINILFTSLRCEDDDVMRVPNNMFFQKAVRRKAGDKRLDLDEQFVKETPTG